MIWIKIVDPDPGTPKNADLDSETPKIRIRIRNPVCQSLSLVPRAHREAVPVDDPRGVPRLTQKFPRDGGGGGGEHGQAGPGQVLP